MLLQSFRLGFTGLLLAALPIASATAQNIYPPVYVENYVRACTGNRGSQVEVICICIVRKAQDTYTFEQFESINNQIQKTKKIPPELMRIMNSCQANPYS